MYVAERLCFTSLHLPLQVEKDKISLSSALSVCVRASEWARALEFLAP